MPATLRTVARVQLIRIVALVFVWRSMPANVFDGLGPGRAGTWEGILSVASFT